MEVQDRLFPSKVIQSNAKGRQKADITVQCDREHTGLHDLNEQENLTLPWSIRKDTGR